MNDKIKTGIYIRVSTEDQAKDGFSIHAQRDKLTKYAELSDWEICDYYVDDGISGKNLTERPEVMRMLKDVESRKINNVLVYKLDRLTRSVKDLIELIELFEEYNCCFNSVTEKIDTSNAVGRMFVKIIGIFAEFERENLAERVSFGYEQKTKEGNYTNTNGVYGYDYIVGEGILRVNEEEKELVNRIFDDYINGNSYFKIATNLNQEHIPTKRGGHFAASTIKSILHNPLYIGKVRYGVHEKNRDKSFIVDGNNIEPIVDLEKWNRVQNTVKTRKHYAIRRYPSEKSYFFHTIKCFKCGGNISARQQKQNGKVYITYRCNNSLKGCCGADGFSHNLMEQAFLEYLSIIKKFEPTEEVLNQTKINNDINQKQNILAKKINRLEYKKKNARTKFIEEEINITEYKGLIEEIDLQKEQLKKELEQIDINIKNQSSNFTYSQIKSLITDIKLNWEYLTNKEKQQFLEQFVENINVGKINNKVVISEVNFKK